MLRNDDFVGLGDVTDTIVRESVEPFVFRHRVQQNALLDLAFEMDTVEDVAQEVVHLHAHHRIEIVHVRGGQYLVRVTHLHAQRCQLKISEGKKLAMF